MSPEEELFSYLFFMLLVQFCFSFLFFLSEEKVYCKRSMSLEPLKISPLILPSTCKPPSTHSPSLCLRRDVCMELCLHVCGCTHICVWVGVCLCVWAISLCISVCTCVCVFVCLCKAKKKKERKKNPTHLLPEPMLPEWISLWEVQSPLQQ